MDCQYQYCYHLMSWGTSEVSDGKLFLSWSIVINKLCLQELCSNLTDGNNMGGKGEKSYLLPTHPIFFAVSVYVIRSTGFFFSLFGLLVKESPNKCKQVCKTNEGSTLFTSSHLPQHCLHILVTKILTTTATVSTGNQLFWLAIANLHFFQAVTADRYWWFGGLSQTQRKHTLILKC